MTSKTQTEEYLRKTQLPVATKSYTVISHGEIIDKVREMLDKHGFIITNELYKAELNGEVALGFMEIETASDPDMAMTFNWTNSYNKMVRFGCSIGGFIYDNKVPFISSNNQSSWKRKHTGTALTETIDIIEAMVESANDHFAEIVKMKNKFKSLTVNRKEYAKLLGLLYFDKQVIYETQISVIRKEYDKPSFDYKDKGTLWELYKMIMFGIVDQSPKSWYKQQVNINNYIQVLYNIASIELENETNEIEVNVSNNEIVEILDLLLNAEDEEQLFDNQTVQEELDSEHVGPLEMYLGDSTTEPSLFNDIDAKKERLEEIREELNNESISYGELVELQDLTEYIEEGDVQLLEAAGVPEFLDNVDDVIVEELTDQLIKDHIVVPIIMSEEEIVLIKESYNVIETGNADDGYIDSKDTNTDYLFDMADEYDELVDELPWFTDENTNQEIELAPNLIPDAIREEVTNVLLDSYQNKRSVINTIEDNDYMVFELDTREFFVINK